MIDSANVPSCIASSNSRAFAFVAESSGVVTPSPLAPMRAPHHAAHSGIDRPLAMKSTSSWYSSFAAVGVVCVIVAEPLS